MSRSAPRCAPNPVTPPTSQCGLPKLEYCILDLHPAIGVAKRGRIGQMNVRRGVGDDIELPETEIRGESTEDA